jgi:hypothetical protein
MWPAMHDEKEESCIMVGVHIVLFLAAVAAQAANAWQRLLLHAGWRQLALFAAGL